MTALSSRSLDTYVFETTKIYGTNKYDCTICCRTRVVALVPSMCSVYIVCLGAVFCKFVTSISGLVLLEIKCSHYQHAVQCSVMTIHAVFSCFNHVLINRMASSCIFHTNPALWCSYCFFPTLCNSCNETTIFLCVYYS